MMVKNHPFFRILASKIGTLILAGLMTFALCLWSLWDLKSQESDLGLKIALHITQQAEKLTLTARENDEPNPLEWAIEQLSAKESTPWLQVFAIQYPKENAAQSFEFDPQTGIFDYIASLSTSPGRGVRVRYSIGYRGVFGARSEIANNVIVLSCFSMLWMLMLLSLNLRKGVGTETKTSSAPIQGKKFDQWLKEVDGATEQLGRSVIQLVKQSNELMSQSAKPADGFEQLEISQKLEDLRALEMEISKCKERALKLALTPEGLQVAEESEKLSRELSEIEIRFSTTVEELLRPLPLRENSTDSNVEQKNRYASTLSQTTQSLMKQREKIHEIAKKSA